MEKLTKVLFYIYFKEDTTQDMRRDIAHAQFEIKEMESKIRFYRFSCCFFIGLFIGSLIMKFI